MLPLPLLLLSLLLSHSFFPPLPHRSIHGCVEKKQGVEDGKKAKGSQEIWGKARLGLGQEF